MRLLRQASRKFQRKCPHCQRSLIERVRVANREAPQDSEIPGMQRVVAEMQNKVAAQGE